MTTVFKRTQGLTEAKTHYCPGCTHGIVHRLVGEVLEEMGLLEEAIAVVPVGCAVTEIWPPLAPRKSFTRLPGVRRSRPFLSTMASMG